MTAREYDDHIRDHYSKVAAAEGLASSSTMADQRIRELETLAIHTFIEDVLRYFDAPGRRPVVADLGCGNGFTVSSLHQRFVGVDLVGVEKTPEMRELAEERFAGVGGDRVSIRGGDLREATVAEPGSFDAVVCQRVLINLLNPVDQQRALRNVIHSVRPGGALLFIEGFASALGRLNHARDEFGLPPLPPAHHNLYLPDDFFDVDGLTPYTSASYETTPQLLSTHYYVSRVLHPLLLGDRVFRRNSEFVSFLSRALPSGVGDYAQLLVRAFTRTA